MLLPHCRCDVECFRSGHYGTRTKMHIVPHCVHLKKGNHKKKKKVIIEERESEAFMTDHFFRDTMWNL